MSRDRSIEKIFAISENIVAREIEGELIIVPLTSGIGNIEDDLYSLNDTGRAIWDLIDGRRSLREIAAELSKQYNASPDDIEKDVQGLTAELRKRGIIISISKGK